MKPTPLDRFMFWTFSFGFLSLSTAVGYIGYKLNLITGPDDIIPMVTNVQTDYLALYNQIISANTTMNLVNDIYLTEFNEISCQKLFKHSNLESLDQARTVVRYYITEGVRIITDSNGNQIHISSRGIPTSPQLS
jgi:hypothetical protein